MACAASTGPQPWAVVVARVQEPLSASRLRTERHRFKLPNPAYTPQLKAGLELTLERLTEPGPTGREIQAQGFGR